MQINLEPRVRSIGIQFDGRDDLPAARVAPVPVQDLSSGGESTDEKGSDTVSLYEPSSASSDDSVPHNIK